MTLKKVFLQENGIFVSFKMKMKMYIYYYLINMVVVMANVTSCTYIDPEKKMKSYFFTK